MGWSDELRREIPAGWDVVQLGSLIESNRGISYNTSTISGGGVPMLNLASFNVDGTYKHKGLKSYNGEYSADKVLKPFDLVMCNTQQTAIDEAKDIIGKAFLVPNIFNGDIVSSHHVTTLKCESILKPYLAYLSNTRHFHKYATGCCSGTNIMGLDFSGIERYRMELPPKSLIQRFYNITIAVEEEKCKAILENERLISLRDELLPLLMNGQVSLNSDLSNILDCFYISFGIYDNYPKWNLSIIRNMRSLILSIFLEYFIDIGERLILQFICSHSSIYIFFSPFNGSFQFAIST